MRKLLLALIVALTIAPAIGEAQAASKAFQTGVFTAAITECDEARNVLIQCQEGEAPSQDEDAAVSQSP